MKIFQFNFLYLFALLIIASVNCQEEPNDVEPVEDDENDLQPPTVAPDEPIPSNSTIDENQPKNETERDYPEEEPETYEENKPENQPENEVIEPENKRNETDVMENQPENAPENEPEEEPEENPENKPDMTENMPEMTGNMPENPEVTDEEPNSQPQPPPFGETPINFHRPDFIRPNYQPMTPLGRYPPLFRTLGGGRSFRAADNQDQNLNNYEVNRIFIVTIHDPLENFTKAQRYQQYMQDKILLDLHRLGMVIEEQMKATQNEESKTKMESMVNNVKQFADLLQANELFNITKIMGQHYESNRRFNRFTPTITVNTNQGMAAPNHQFQPNHHFQPPVNYDQYEQ
jgi:hypothetical protein